MSLSKEFAWAVLANETALAIETDEYNDALAALQASCQANHWTLRFFDPLHGVVTLHGEPPPAPPVPAGNNLSPLGPAPARPPDLVRALHEFWLEPPRPDEATGAAGDWQARPVVLVVDGFYRACDGLRVPANDVVALVRHLCDDKVCNHRGADELAALGLSLEASLGKTLLLLLPPGCRDRLPPELQPRFKFLTHELADTAELAEIAAGCLDPVPPAAVLAAAAKAARGLTRRQAEGVFASGSQRHGRAADFAAALPRYVWQEKAAALNREGLVELYQGREAFADVVGLAGVKHFLRQALLPRNFAEAAAEHRARGLVLVGPPGTGKSMIVKAVGNELNLPALLAHPGNLMGGLVGDTEAKTRKFFQVVRAMAPCLVLVDEVDKVMPRAGQGHDGGVGARMLGTFLTQMNDMVEPVFWCFSANSVADMNEAFFRAERVDGVFYVGLPGVAQRAAAWRLYLGKYFPERQAAALAALELLKQNAYRPATLAADAAAVLASAWLMTAERDAVLRGAAAHSGALHQQVAGLKFEDAGWTPAEIKSCCRLAHLLDEDVTRARLRVRPVAATAPEPLQRLYDWAQQSALDAETGLAYGAEAAPEAGAAAANGRSAVQVKRRSLPPIKKEPS